MTMMKRQRETKEEKESMDIITSLMLLSRATQEAKPAPLQKSLEFECKTCNRKFSSFQALGGHRASHKKPKLDGEALKSEAKESKNKPKMHECSICGQEFSLGQALGGHMRRHRINDGFSASSIKQVIAKVPVLKRSNSKRIMCLELDLNLTPLENDLKLLFGEKAPRVDLSLF